MACFNNLKLKIHPYRMNGKSRPYMWKGYRKISSKTEIAITFCSHVKPYIPSAVGGRILGTDHHQNARQITQIFFSGRYIKTRMLRPRDVGQADQYIYWSWPKKMTKSLTITWTGVNFMHYQFEYPIVLTVQGTLNVNLPGWENMQRTTSFRLMLFSIQFFNHIKKDKIINDCVWYYLRSC